MATVRALSIILGCWAMGELIVFLTGVHFPASIFGLFILFGALQLGWVNVESVRQLADVLMANLALFLIPPCVAIMGYLDLLAKDWLSLSVATFVSTWTVMWVSGKTHEWLRKRKP